MEMFGLFSLPWFTMVCGRYDWMILHGILGEFKMVYGDIEVDLME